MINNLMSTKIINSIIIFTIVLFTSISYAAKAEIPMFETTVTGQGKHIGNIIAEDTPFGLLLTPSFEGLTHGPHGSIFMKSLHVVPRMRNLD